VSGAGGGSPPQEQPVDRRHRRTRRLPTEDAEFVLQHDDFQFLEVV